MGTQIKPCVYYKYLVLNLSTRGTWSKQQKHCLSKPVKLYLFLRKLRKTCNLPFDITCNLFYKMILPILSYGSEIWEYECYGAIENVHNFFLKTLYGTGIPNK